MSFVWSCVCVDDVRWRNLHGGECWWHERLLPCHLAVWVLSSCFWSVESCWGQPVSAGTTATTSVICCLVLRSTNHNWRHCSSICDWLSCAKVNQSQLEPLQQHLWLVVLCQGRPITAQAIAAASVIGCLVLVKVHQSQITLQLVTFY